MRDGNCSVGGTVTREVSFLRGRYITGIIVGLCLAAAAGCGDGNFDVPQITIHHVLKVDGESYSIPQAKVYAVNYQNLYGTVSGIDLWQTDNQTGSEEMERYVKDLSVSQMTKILSMDSLARSRGLELEEAELSDARKAARAYYNSLTDAEHTYLGVTESELAQLYEDYALARKLYRFLIGQVNEEVSDDQARIMEAMQIVVSDKAAAKRVKKALKEGGDFAAVASTYNEAEESRIQIGRGSLPAAVELAAFALEDGEVSKCIEAEAKYYYLYCVNKFNAELTDANKQTIVQQREKEAFGDVYDAYSKTISRKLYSKVWDRVELDTSEDITTDRFFEVYKEYCNEQ